MEKKVKNANFSGVICRQMKFSYTMRTVQSYLKAVCLWLMVLCVLLQPATKKIG